MVAELKLTRAKGGDHHPLSVRGFILDHLLFIAEDYIANMHRAYKEELDNVARRNGRQFAYHKPVYHSFEMAVQRLAREGLIEFSGHEEESDNPQFANWEQKPVRRYYRLAGGRPSAPTGVLTRKTASELTNGHGIVTELTRRLPKPTVSPDGGTASR